MSRPLAVLATVLSVVVVPNLWATAAPTAALPTGAVPTATAGCLPSHDGFLRLRMRGAADADIDWHDGELHCEGGPRPEGRGRRVAFAGTARTAGTAGSGHQMRIVFGIGAAHSGERNLPVNITVIFEGERRLYSTYGDDKCTIDSLREEPWRGDGAARWRRITARGFCVEPARPVAAARVGAALLISRFDFAGKISE